MHTNPKRERGNAVDMTRETGMDISLTRSANFGRALIVESVGQCENAQSWSS